MNKRLKVLRFILEWVLFFIISLPALGLLSIESPQNLSILQFSSVILVYSYTLFFSYFVAEKIVNWLFKGLEASI